MRKLIDDKAILPPSPSPSPLFTVEISNYNPPSSFFDLLPSLPVNGSAYDLATLTGIFLLLLLSLLSLSIIFHLRLQSRWSHHLQNFSSIWSVRLLLVAFTSIWAVNEILRLPLVRRQYIYSFMPPLTLTEEANICKTYLVLSLGLIQPAILITLLFLVRVSIKNNSPSNISAISAIGATCLPIMLLQILILFLSPLEAQLPAIMYRSSFLSEDIYGDKTVFCTYPLLSCMAFTAFGGVYALGLLMSCWRVLSLVINKCIRRRINVLALTVCMALPLQSLCMALSSMGSPENAAFSGVVMAMFVCVAICAVVGMCILVIMPTVDALAAVAEFDWWNLLVRLRLEGDVSCRSRREEGDVSFRSRREEGNGSR